MVKEAELTNEVKKMSLEESKAVLSGLVEMFIHFEGQNSLNEHANLWNYLVHNKAINTVAPDRPGK
ncbi:MAG: hypothetical protein IJ641_11310 [Lachnospiraceae bacterium]|nr:hypothetical protein [Lachnospiraceae bacterium]